MAEYLKILILLIILNSCADEAIKEHKLSYPTRNKYSDSICYRRVCDAIDDANLGIYKLYEFGIVSSLDTNRVILKKYNVDLIYGGDAILEGDLCYASFMDSIIRERFSKFIVKSKIDYFNRARFKDEFFNLTDSTGKQRNIKIITDILNGLSGLQKGRPGIQILINKFGKPIKLKWLKGLGSKNDSIVLSMLSKKTFFPLIIGNDTLNSILTTQIKIL